MEVVSVPGGDTPNEDWFGGTADAVVVLDGVSVLPGIVSGCVHETPWYARSPRLGERLGEARRAHRNRPGGYWVAADDPVAADHAITGSVPLETVRGVMVLSDGAARLVDLFGRDWAYAVAAGPAEIIRQVRALEDEDPGCVRWPRTRNRDDATAARWTLPLGKGTR